MQFHGFFPVQVEPGQIPNPKSKLSDLGCSKLKHEPLSGRESWIPLASKSPGFVLSLSLPPHLWNSKACPSLFPVCSLSWNLMINTVKRDLELSFGARLLCHKLEFGISTGVWCCQVAGHMEQG